MLMTDRPRMLDDDAARRGLEATPAHERLVRVAGQPEDVRRVQAGAARVDVGQVAERKDAFAKVVETVSQSLLDRCGEIRQAGPVDRGLEGVDGVACLPQGVAEIGRAEAV